MPAAWDRESRDISKSLVKLLCHELLHALFSAPRSLTVPSQRCCHTVCRSITVCEELIPRIKRRLHRGVFHGSSSAVKQSSRSHRRLFQAWRLLDRDKNGLRPRDRCVRAHLPVPALAAIPKTPPCRPMESWRTPKLTLCWGHAPKDYGNRSCRQPCVYNTPLLVATN